MRPNGIPQEVLLVVLSIAVALVASAAADSENCMMLSVHQSSSGDGAADLKYNAVNCATAGGPGNSIHLNSLQNSMNLPAGADIRLSAVNWVTSSGQGGGNEISVDNIQSMQGTHSAVQKIMNYGVVAGSGNEVDAHNLQDVAGIDKVGMPMGTENFIIIRGNGNAIDLDNQLDLQYSGSEQPLDLSQSNLISVNGNDNLISHSNKALGPVISSTQEYFGIIV
jgi:hypothetical protein